MSTACVLPAYFRQAVKYLMNDPAGTVYTDARIDEAFTEAIRKVAREHYCFREEASGNCTANQIAQARLVTGMPIEIEDVIIAEATVRRRLGRADRRTGLDKTPVIGWPSVAWFALPSTLNIYEAPPDTRAYTVAARTLPTMTQWVTGTPAEIEELLIVETIRVLHRPLRESAAEAALNEEADFFGPLAETAVDANHALPEAMSGDGYSGDPRSY